MPRRVNQRCPQTILSSIKTWFSRPWLTYSTMKALIQDSGIHIWSSSSESWQNHESLHRLSTCNTSLLKTALKITVQILKNSQHDVEPDLEIHQLGRTSPVECWSRIHGRQGATNHTSSFLWNLSRRPLDLPPRWAKTDSSIPHALRQHPQSGTLFLSGQNRRRCGQVEFHPSTHKSALH